MIICIFIFLNFQSGWNRRNHPNVKFIWFEDMKTNQRQIIEETSQFLGFHLTTKQVHIQS